jgi:hypothetical protein
VLLLELPSSALLPLASFPVPSLPLQCHFTTALFSGATLIPWWRSPQQSMLALSLSLLNPQCQGDWEGLPACPGPFS